MANTDQSKAIKQSVPNTENHLELIIAKRYVLLSKVYQKGVVYKLPDKIYKYLSKQKNEQGIHYFRKPEDNRKAIEPAGRAYNEMELKGFDIGNDTTADEDIGIEVG